MNELELIQFFLPKVLMASICGAIIGIEREMKNKVAGIRTNILICAGTAIFAATSIFIAKLFNDVDPTRIIGQIVTGVGFLGGGVIFKVNDKLTGVTTASFIWVMCAIGVMCGLGLYLTPILLTIGLVAISIIFQRIEKRIYSYNEKKDSPNEDRD